MSQGNEIRLTEKQRRFCEEYVIDWNASRAAKVAGYKEKTAPAIGFENLQKPEIQAYIQTIRSDLEKTAQVSALMVLLEYKKIAFSSIAAIKDDWAEMKDWETLTDDQKASIAQIKHTKYSTKEGVSETIEVKLHDKVRSLDQICKMLGYAPEEFKGEVKITVEEKQIS